MKYLMLSAVLALVACGGNHSPLVATYDPDDTAVEDSPPFEEAGDVQVPDAGTVEETVAVPPECQLVCTEYKLVQCGHVPFECGEGPSFKLICLTYEIQCPAPVTDGGTPPPPPPTDGGTDAGTPPPHDQRDNPHKHGCAHGKKKGDKNCHDD